MQQQRARVYPVPMTPRTPDVGGHLWICTVLATNSGKYPHQYLCSVLAGGVDQAIGRVREDLKISPKSKIWKVQALRITNMNSVSSLLDVMLKETMDRAVINARP